MSSTNLISKKDAEYSQQCTLIIYTKTAFENSRSPSARQLRIVIAMILKTVQRLFHILYPKSNNLNSFSTATDLLIFAFCILKLFIIYYYNCRLDNLMICSLSFQFHDRLKVGLSNG